MDLWLEVAELVRVRVTMWASTAVRVHDIPRRGLSLWRGEDADQSSRHDLAVAKPDGRFDVIDNKALSKATFLL